MVDIDGMLLAYTPVFVIGVLFACIHKPKCSTGGILLAYIVQGLTGIMLLAYTIIWLAIVGRRKNCIHYHRPAKKVFV